MVFFYFQVSNKSISAQKSFPSETHENAKDVENREMVVTFYCLSQFSNAQKFEDFFAKGIKVKICDINDPKVTHILTANPKCNGKTFGALVSGKKFLKALSYAEDCIKADEILMNFSKYEYFKTNQEVDQTWQKMELSKQLEDIVGTNEAYQYDVAKLMT